MGCLDNHCRIHSSAIVHRTGDERVNGEKEFETLPVSSAEPSKLTHLVTKTYTDTQRDAALQNAKDYTDLQANNLKTEFDKNVQDAPTTGSGSASRGRSSQTGTCASTVIAGVVHECLHLVAFASLSALP